METKTILMLHLRLRECLTEFHLKMKTLRVTCSLMLHLVSVFILKDILIAILFELIKNVTPFFACSLMLHFVSVFILKGILIAILFELIKKKCDFVFCIFKERGGKI